MEDAHSLRKYQKDVRQQLHHDDRHHRFHASEPRDWRAILRTLSNSTSVYSPVKGIVQVIFPETSIHLLRSSTTDSIWDIRSRTGCGMQLHEKRQDNPDDQTYLLLSGEKSSIDRAVKAITELAGRVTVLHLTENDASMLLPEVSPILWRRDFSVPTKNTLPLRPDEVKVPEQWTETSFERYLSVLMDSRVPISLLPKISPNEHYSTAVVRKIRQTFHNPLARHALTVTSFKLALRYITRFGTTYWNYAQELYRMMAACGFEIDSEVYDIMAQASIKENNLGFFHGIVYKMARHGCPPSFQTWIHFLRLIKAEEIRRYIVQEMVVKGLFSHPLAMRCLANELIEHDLFRAVQLGFDLQTFIAGQNELYGPQWLHHQAANKVLIALGKHGRFDDMTEFLKLMFASKSARPYNEIALNIVLTHCKTQRKLDAAIGYVKLFEKEMGVLKTDAITYHLLFELAWKLQKPHMISVLWRYAHLKMDVSWRMDFRGRRLDTPSPLPLGFMKEAHALTSRLRLVGVLPISKDRSVKYTQRERAASNRVLSLAMQNLLFVDYKRANGIDKGEMLTDEQVKHAIDVWYLEQFEEFRPRFKLGDVLELALKEDRRNKAESHAGKEVVLEPIPLPVGRRGSRRSRKVIFIRRRRAGLVRRIVVTKTETEETAVPRTEPLIQRSVAETRPLIRRVKAQEQTTTKEAEVLIRRVKDHAVEERPMIRRVKQVKQVTRKKAKKKAKKVDKGGGKEAVTEGVAVLDKPSIEKKHGEETV